MGKTLNRDQRKNHKYMERETGRKRKEQEQIRFMNYSEEPPKEKSKKKWRPHSNSDD